MNQIVVIIPARNEAGRVGNVVRAAKAAKYPTSVWVVDNGSTDDTANEAVGAGAELLHYPEQGKGNAVAWAMRRLVDDDDIIVLLDADLIGLSSAHVDRLVEPVIGGQYVQSCAVRKASQLHRLAWRWHVGLSGERAFRAGLLWEVWHLDYQAWSLETALNSICRWSPLRAKRPIAKMYFGDVTDVDKRHKYTAPSQWRAAKRQVFVQVVRAYLRFVLPIKYKSKLG